jgi:hypothetical protein
MLTHFILLDTMTLIIFDEAYNLHSSSLCTLLPSDVNFLPLRSYILLSTLFSYTFNLCSSLYVRCQFLHQYKTTGRIVVL